MAVVLMFVHYFDRGLKRLIAIELKLGKFTASHKGQNLTELPPCEILEEKLRNAIKLGNEKFKKMEIKKSD